MKSALDEAVRTILASEHTAYTHTKALIEGLPREGKHAALTRGGNAGAVSITEGDPRRIVFKIESHNHPSAVLPREGAATGVGGIVRDILAMGARPIAILDALRLPPPEPGNMPLIEGVIEGISWYANSIGVPTVGGETVYHEGYSGAPLVNVMCAGITEKLLEPGKGEAGDLLILAGGRTGPDGLGGAAFASRPLSGDDERPSVQIADPYAGKLLIDRSMEVFGKGLAKGAQDLGAGGLASAVAETAASSGCGARIDLDAVPLQSAGMDPAAILLSESQERMLFVASEDGAKGITGIFVGGPHASAVIGRLDETGRLRAERGGEILLDIPIERPGAVIIGPPGKPPRSWRPMPVEIPDPSFVYERFDHGVGGDTVMGPGEGPAAVVRIGENEGLALALAGTRIGGSPLETVGGAVSEALEAICEVGAEPLGMTNGINLGPPEDPNVADELFATFSALGASASREGIPIVSGNVSLYNSGENGPIPPTIFIGIVGYIGDLARIFHESHEIFGPGCIIRGR